MLISVAVFLESGMECMLTQLSLRKALLGGGARLELRVPEFGSTCPPPIACTSSFSALVGGGAEETAITGVTVTDV